MMESVYIETTIVSYVVGRPSKDPLLAAHQQLTREWWDKERLRYRCVTSGEVVREALHGEEQMARKRLAILAEMIVLEVTPEMQRIADQFLGTGAISAKVRSDALHLSVAMCAGIDYLLTWNCRHLANAQILRRLEREAVRMGRIFPTVCTPLELIGDRSDAFE